MMMSDLWISLVDKNPNIYTTMASNNNRHSYASFHGRYGLIGLMKLRRQTEPGSLTSLSLLGILN